ncbi:MAG: hypothetical protein F6J93_16795 [Oscillatoria sp. SIO1A7]|nr:hypothetical protein [Oscillatoria sp. SIO1A7]
MLRPETSVKVKSQKLKVKSCRGDSIPETSLVYNRNVLCWNASPRNLGKSQKLKVKSQKL